MLLEEKIFLGIVGSIGGLVMVLFSPLHIIAAVSVFITTVGFGVWLLFFLFDRGWGPFTSTLLLLLIVLFGSISISFIIIGGI